MRFGEVDLAQAAGAILAHSLRVGPVVLRKGHVLEAADLAALAHEGITRVTVARLEKGDVTEDAAAGALAGALLAPGIEAAEAFSGRVNLVAQQAGLFMVDGAAVGALNRVDEAITLATLPNATRVSPGTLLATIKIIPYGVPSDAVLAALKTVGQSPLALRPNAIKTASLVLTETPGLKPSLITKAQQVTQTRLAALGITLDDVRVVPHRVPDLAAALQQGQGDLRLILGGSATSDRADVVPSAVAQAGGQITRFGMPVDPGNLLFVGQMNGAPVLGLPGCARSPALNGADWVLQRLVAGLPVEADDLAAMGVGGLLKEIPQRNQPRRAPPATAPKIAILMLAAGASRRMGGQDKLLRPIDGVPLLRRAADRAARVADTPLIVVLPPDAPARHAALEGCDAQQVTAPDAADGMAASLRAGLAALPSDTTAVIIALADMPDVETDHYSQLIAAFDPAKGHEICRAQAADGMPGHPVLFSRRFFESLSDLTGDRGARDIVAQSRDMLVDVPMSGQAPVVDLDTPDDWALWEAGQGG